MGCAGNSEIRTPNLDRLSQSGMMLTNLFCASPVCSPARASLLTGRIPSQHGVHDWLCGGNAPIETDQSGRVIEYLRDQPGYTDVLAHHGYQCGISGKWHLGDSLHRQKSFSFWEVHATGGATYYNAPLVQNGAIYREKRYVTDVITDNALLFLDQQQSSETPFYLSVHYTAPHSPWSRENHPQTLWDEYFRHCSFTSTPEDAMHPWQRYVADWAQVYADPQKRKELLSGYFAAVTAMDANLGRIVDKLEERELRENTLVFFTSDNGMNMGHHGIYGKGNGTFPLNMYDTSVKVPGIMSRPGHIPQATRCDALISHYDFFPTLLDYLKIEIPSSAELPGKSFAPLLDGRNYTPREKVVVFDEYGPVRMVRTEEWKYIHRYPYGPHELYDLHEDPLESRNLYQDTRFAPRVIELKRSLDDWFAAHVDPGRDGAREPVSGEGQCGPVGPAAAGRSAFRGGARRMGEV